MEREVEDLLRQHPALSLGPDSRVRCSLTNHELPCRLADLQAYTSGKKYQRLVTSQPFRYEQFEPHVVPSTKNPQQLFCKLTLRHINRIPQHVLRHVNGKRYQKAQHQYEECQRMGIPYVPACMSGKNKKRRDRSDKAGDRHKLWEPDSSEGEEADSDDSLSDLYPKEIFKRDAPGKGEDSDEFLSDNEECEKMEVESQAQGKRKKKQPTSSSKKLKNGRGQQPGSRRGKHRPRAANST
uniref:Surfeit locus protein 2-like protein n=1 Tax=Callorhinchus milii TaxID=7868 RepID=V9KK28_CALMI